MTTDPGAGQGPLPPVLNRRGAITPSSLAAADVAAIAPAAASPEVRDSRSVGELLRQADAEVRDVLLGVDPREAGLRVRGLVAVLESATSVWQALPGARYDQTMPHLHAVAQTLTRSAGRWADGVDGDPGMDRAASLLARANELIRNHHTGSQALQRPGVPEDIAATRVQLMHIAWVSTHACSVAVRSSAAAGGKGAAQQRNLLPRLDRMERRAQGWLAGRWPGDLAGEYRPAPPDLALSMARWDVAAMRVLADRPNATELLLISAVQRDLTILGQRLTTAAAETGVAASTGEQLNDLSHDLDDTETGWVAVQRQWRVLSPLVTPVRPALAAAAIEVRTSARELLHDNGAYATTGVVAGRIDLSEAVKAVRRTHANGQEVVDAMADALPQALRDLAQIGHVRALSQVSLPPGPIQRALDVLASTYRAASSSIAPASEEPSPGRSTPYHRDRSPGAQPGQLDQRHATRGPRW